MILDHHHDRPLDNGEIAAGKPISREVERIDAAYPRTDAATRPSILAASKHGGKGCCGRDHAAIIAPVKSAVECGLAVQCARFSTCGRGFAPNNPRSGRRDRAGRDRETSSARKIAVRHKAGQAAI